MWAVWLLVLVVLGVFVAVDQMYRQLPLWFRAMVLVLALGGAALKHMQQRTWF